MECRNEWCIYQQKWKCLLDEITVNEAGDCESCIMVSLPEKTHACLTRFPWTKQVSANPASWCRCRPEHLPVAKRKYSTDWIKKIEKTKAAIPRWLLWFLMEAMPGI